MEEPEACRLVQELHADLERKYRQHGDRVETMWRTFDRAQRERCVKAGAIDGGVLAHPLDQSLGVACELVPEWNLRDLTEPGSDFLLDHLRHRSATSLSGQYSKGVAGGPGDFQVIDEMMCTRGLRHARSFEDCYTVFCDGQYYGSSYQVLEGRDEFLAMFAHCFEAGLIIPRATGELILHRQTLLLQSMVIVIDDILEEGSKLRAKKEPPKKPDTAATAALAKMATRPSPPTKLELPDLVVSARDQRASLEEYVGLLSAEPSVLTCVVNAWFFSQPGLVADEKGRMLPVHTDKYVSAAAFDAVHSLVKGAAIWTYITCLLHLLEDANTDKIYRAIVLQEVSNICHLEYGRARSLLKRHVQCGIGRVWFKRRSGVYDRAGNARVNMKVSPDQLTRVDPQVHYLLRLCQDKTGAREAVDWIKRLTELHEAHPEERERLSDREAGALCDLAAIIGFIWEASPAISMPPQSRRKGRMFVSRSQELEAELNAARREVDLRDYVVPIGNLLEPGVAEGALGALDRLVSDKTGTKMGFLYQDLVENCLSDLQGQYQHIRSQTETKGSAPLRVPTPQPTEKRVEARRQKEKTRPRTACTFELVPTAEEAPPPPPASPLTVASSTAEVFQTLFKRSESRGSVSWAAFEAAMVDLGFSITPSLGSIYTFRPPDGMAVQKPLTLHRPHAPHIEGLKILFLARRLNRTYGWGEGTFEVA